MLTPSHRNRLQRSRNLRGQLLCVAWLSCVLLACPQVLDDKFILTGPSAATDSSQGGTGGSPREDASLALGGSGGFLAPGRAGSGGQAPLSASLDAGRSSYDAGFDARAAVTDAAATVDASTSTDAGLDSGPAPPTCDDGLLNQSETAIDCGGECSACVFVSLTHRYSFIGLGTSALDSVGTAHGTVINASLSGVGTVVLVGGNDYVDLPDAIVSGLTSATIEVWLTWSGGQSWQRIFDFGSSTSGTAQQEFGDTYWSLSPRGENNRLSTMFTNNLFANEIRVIGPTIMPSNQLVHLATVIDEPSSTFSLYLNGVLQSSETLNLNLSQLDDTNNWLGRSQFSTDPDLAATFTEFRIYNRSLSAAELALSFTAGPDAQ